MSLTWRYRKHRVTATGEIAWVVAGYAGMAMGAFLHNPEIASAGAVAFVVGIVQLFSRR